MKKFDELKDIMWRLNLTSCNLIQYVDEKMLDELVNNLINKFESYSDDGEKYFPIIIDSNKLQQFSISLEDRVIEDARIKEILITDEDYKLVELRKKTLKMKDLDELREAKLKIFNLEKLNISEKIRDMKKLLLEEYFVCLFPICLFEKYEIMNEYVNEYDLKKLNNRVNFLKENSIDINKLLELDSLFFDDETFYNYIREISIDYRKVVPAILIHGESIVDYDLQEQINYYMCNQRSGVFTLNFITSDAIYHRYFKNWYLEDTNDVITTNVRSKRYLKTFKPDYEQEYGK